MADGYIRYSHCIGKEIWMYPKEMEVQQRSKHFNSMDEISILSFLLYLQLSFDKKERRVALHICLFQLFQNKLALMDLLGPCSTWAHEGENPSSDWSQQRTQDLLTTQYKAFNWLLKTYATGGKASRAVHSVTAFKHPASMSPAAYGNTLVSKNFRWGSKPYIK